jgi:hypothetical protein
MPNDGTTIDALRAEDDQAQADFDAGAATEAPEKPGAAAAEAPANPNPAAKPRAAAEPAPEYVQVTRKDWEEVRAAAAATASHGSQLSKAFGTLGNLQKSLTDLQNAAPQAGKFEIPKGAFADLERDFPELAEQIRAGIEATMTARGGGGDATAKFDPAEVRRIALEDRLRAEAETLEEEHPDWKAITGAVDATKQKPDPNNPFRKWLATQTNDYQAKLNSTISAAVISRAITRFKEETRKPGGGATNTMNAALRASRIKNAVQPRGDGGRGGQVDTDEDEFEAGFSSR